MTYQLKTKKMKTKSEKISFFPTGKVVLIAMVLAFVSIFSNNLKAETGEELYKKNCSSCHALSAKSLVGPGLAGLSDRRSEEWSVDWIKNSAELIASGDEDAIAIFKEYNEIPMTNFTDLSDEEIKGILAYISEAAVVTETASTTGSGAVTATQSEESPIIINTQMLFWGLLALGIVLFFIVRYVSRTKEQIGAMGYHPDAHKVKNYPLIFVVILFLFVLGAYVLINLLGTDSSVVNNVLFMVFPYVAFTLFIAGSIYRWTKKGYQVSSLSSQFIEGKKLFWGSQPFHWGLLVLFLGHLTAFLFPSAVLAWNGEPVRLLILEISSFAFGLLALLGLILLIKRRLETKTLLVVTNKMDMVVYAVLFTQIISGLGVAFAVRWGSSWFASVLTPYLRSIFTFDPDISAVSSMPWWIQIHIISAFLIIAIIPFTRFMHFLVTPIDYAWRKYQVVVWNWNRKSIRKSTQHTFGKKSRNH